MHTLRGRSVIGMFCLAAMAATASSARGQTLPPPSPPPTPSGPEILQQLKAFGSMASVLMVAAHPDDENTQLITYLARGRNYRMAYLSVTRGDGGQNLLGPEFGDALGLIRTNELLAARSLDLGRQYFTRAIDFGYSKSPEETLKIWDRDAVLGDVVRVIREFRPDVVITRFPPTTSPGQHGHHTASAILAIDAFKIAGDPKAYPEQMEQGLAPWQPKRILMNANAAPGTPPGGSPNALRIDAGGMDPVLNESYAAISAQSRAMHKTQGFGATGGGGRGPGAGGGSAPQPFSLLGGAPATQDIMDGIDTTWARIDAASDVGPRYGAQIAKLTADAIAAFDAKNPEATAPALLEIKKLVDGVPTPKPADPILDEKRTLIDQLIAECLGLTADATLANAEVTPGQQLALHLAAHETGKTKVGWSTIRFLTTGHMSSNGDTKWFDMQPGVTDARDMTDGLPSDTPVSQPYWLRESPDPGIYHVADPTLIGRPMNPPVFPVEFSFQVGGQTIKLTQEPVQLLPDAPPPQRRRPLSVIAPVYFKMPYDVALFWQRPNSHQYDVEVNAAAPNVKGTLTLQVPGGWKVQPESMPLELAAAGQTQKLSFTITAPETAGSGEIRAVATINGVSYGVEREQIAYDHLPVLLMQPPAQVRAVSLDVKHLCRNPVGYLPGAGDSVAEAIAQLGIQVKVLKPEDLTAEGLKGLDAVVIGVRAFNAREDLGPNSPGLKAIFDYAAAGGTVIEQYNRPDGPGGTNGRATTLAPFPLHISTLRVTNENAPVKFLVPDSPALNVPNKITDADFANWVQERNIYLPDQFGPEFKPILDMADPGESPPNSSLLIAQTGKGYFVYTSLVFFRELPAGNPGAYRLFANLLSLGKE